jgi:hypothetical protein
MARMGVYDNCYQIGGICWDFIQKTIVGGRVMMRNNEWQFIDCAGTNDKI